MQLHALTNPKDFFNGSSMFFNKPLWVHFHVSFPVHKGLNGSL
jgi:hypothetical protein